MRPRTFFLALALRLLKLCLNQGDLRLAGACLTHLVIELALNGAQLRLHFFFISAPLFGGTLANLFDLVILVFDYFFHLFGVELHLAMKQAQFLFFFAYRGRPLVLFVLEAFFGFAQTPGINSF